MPERESCDRVGCMAAFRNFEEFEAGFEDLVDLAQVGRWTGSGAGGGCCGQRGLSVCLGNSGLADCCLRLRRVCVGSSGWVCLAIMGLLSLGE